MKQLLPELERGLLAYVLLMFGAICTVLELFDPDRVHGRLVLFVVIAAAGVLGVLRRKRPS